MKEVEFGEVEATELRVKPNLPVLGPKLGKELGAVRAALEAGEFEELERWASASAGHELGRGRGARRAGRQGGLGGRASPTGSRSRSTRRSTQELELERPRARPDPRAERDAQGRGPRAHRPHRRHAPAADVATSSSTRGLDQDAKSWPSRSEPTAAAPNHKSPRPNPGVRPRLESVATSSRKPRLRSRVAMARLPSVRGASSSSPDGRRGVPRHGSGRGPATDLSRRQRIDVSS